MNDLIREILFSGTKFWGTTTKYIWAMLTANLSEWNNGVLWDVVVQINAALKDIAYGLIIVFFGIGLIKETSSFAELRNPGTILKLFIRYIIAKMIVGFSIDFMNTIYKIVGGIVAKIHDTGFTEIYTGRGGGIPQAVTDAIYSIPWYASIVGLIFSIITFIVIVTLTVTVMLTVYSRFFRLYIYTAMAPVMLSPIAGEGTQNIGWQFVKGYISVCLEAVVIGLAMIIYSKLATVITISSWFNSGSMLTLVLGYMGEIVFHMLLMTGIVKGASGIIKEMSSL